MMKSIIQRLDENLEYLGHEIIDDKYYITVKGRREEVACPHCGCMSSKVHSRYTKTVQDLPIQGMKVILVIKNRNMFCKNKACIIKTFGEQYEFLPYKGKKTKRVEAEILRVSLLCSSVSASELLRRSVADVGKSTICNLLKKNREFDR